MRRLNLFFFGLAVVVSSLPQVHSKTNEACKECIIKHEKQKGIEPGLLEAIVQIESKFKPYAVNACGRAHNFGSAAEAARFVQDKQNQGYQNISVGPAQLHVPSHRGKFPNLERMIELEGNIACAAKLLKRLKQQTGSWEGAVKRYHSADPYAGERYRSMVFGAWAKIRKVRGKWDSKAGKKKNPALKVAYKSAQESKSSPATAFLLKHLLSFQDCENQTKKGAANKKSMAKLAANYNRTLNQNLCNPTYLTSLTCADTLLSHHTKGFEHCQKVNQITQTAQ